MNLDLKNIKNIIFDLGGVIININPELTTQAFAQLTGKSFSEIKEKLISLNLFFKYEVGELTDSEFRAVVKEFTGGINENKIDEAWNALLLDMPVKRIELLHSLASKYRLFLLSNTNFIHFYEVEKIFQRTTGIGSFRNLFEKVYLSCEIKLCKPHAEIYHYVLKDSKLAPSETLFIDDNSDNIFAASALGINAVHLQPPTTIIDLFNEAKLS